MTRTPSRLVGLIASIAGPALLASPAAAATFSPAPGLSNDGQAGSLRAAVIAANHNPGPDTIVLQSGVYRLLMGGPGEEAGDLNVTDDLEIVGSPGAVIDGFGLHGILEIDSAVTLKISDVRLTQGDSIDHGGAILNNGTLFANDVDFFSNQGNGGGGALSNKENATATLERVLIRHNFSSGFQDGGGILNRGTLSIVNSTLTDNVAGRFGRGGAIANFGSLNLQNVTIDGNRVTRADGANVYSETDVRMLNTIVASPLGTDPAGNPALDSFTLAAGSTHNLFVNPGLRPLADNGGPTLTQAILAGSGAVDGGDNASCPAVDQRGASRPQDGNRDGIDTCDIGAFEVANTVGVPSATGAGVVTLSTDAGSFVGFRPVAESSLPTAGKPAGVTFPFGFFGWTITGLTPGQSVTVTMTYPSSVTSPAQYWKVINGAWVDLTGQIGDDDGDAVLTLSITDGGTGDGDGLADGQIVDPGGVGIEGITPDTTPPAITCPADLTQPNDPGQATAVVSYSVPASDNEPGVSVTSSPASGWMFPLGPTTVTAVATDAAGNTATCSFTVTVVDTEPPSIAAPPAITAEATSAAGAVVSDAVLGSATSSDNAPGVVVTRAGVPPGNLFPLGSTIVSYTATDAAGNTASAQQAVSVRDTTPPTIVIDAPAASATYVLNQHVAASYRCLDAVTSPGPCDGPVASGSDFDTASPGTKTFTVRARDTAGNVSSTSVSYTVAYRACLLYDPSRAARSGSTMPIRMQLCDTSGVNASRPDVVVTAVRLVRLSDTTTGDVMDAGNANPDSNFRYDAALGGTGGYIFNLKTTELAAGAYVLVWTATDDPILHASEVMFQVK